jgi:hypothetical protein
VVRDIETQGQGDSNHSDSEGNEDEEDRGSDS